MTDSLVYHVTTPKKIARYRASGGILPPVRFWGCEHSARRWARKVGRAVILGFEKPARSYPLPMKGPAWWSPDMVPLEAFSDQIGAE
jgi:hypothetical protein